LRSFGLASLFRQIDDVQKKGTGANRLGESVKVSSLTNWWPVMSKRKGLEGMFDGRHFDREIIILCVRWIEPVSRWTSCSGQSAT